MHDPSAFFDGLNPADQRETVINWPGLVQRVVDDYRQHTVLAHGVQKDAIQNAWDARLNRRSGTGWSCRFDLHRASNGHTFLAITDSGTTGLTGRVLTPAEYFQDLPDDERWARFESLAFTHPDSAEDQLGARGQGKFIFVGASQKFRILYDTLRADGVYRLGIRTVDQVRSPVYSWEGDEAKEHLQRYTPLLSPLSIVGTRVIIDEPVEELVSAILNRDFARFIAETWWPILTRLSADIQVSVMDEGQARATTSVVAPGDFELPTQDNGDSDVWLLENRRLEYQGERYVVKRLHIIHRKAGPVAADLQGVAMIRGVMKVMSIPMRHVPADLSQAVYGYVEFDKDLDLEMKRLESPTHYSFDLGRGVGRKVRTFIEDELERFATTKLGQGADPRAVQAQRHREAERRALAAINRAARNLGILGHHGPGGGIAPPSGGTDQPLAAVIIPPVFPGGGRRVNFGEGFEASAFARSRIDASAKIRLSLSITKQEATVEKVGEKILDVLPMAESETLGPASLKFTLGQTEPGEYVLRAKATLLEDAGGLLKGHEHKAAYRFWLEQDPPEIGIFDSVEGLDYAGRPIDAEVVASERGGWKFQYNTSHPAKRREDQSEESLFDYLLRLMARELMYVDLRSAEPTQFNAEELNSPDDTFRKASRVISKILFDYYG